MGKEGKERLKRVTKAVAVSGMVLTSTACGHLNEFASNPKGYIKNERYKEFDACQTKFRILACPSDSAFDRYQAEHPEKGPLIIGPIVSPEGFQILRGRF